MTAVIDANLPKKKKDGECAAVYARYSSHTQGEQSIEGQLAEAYKYAEAHGYTIVHEYIDRAKSGRTDNREAFQRMLKDTAKKQFTVVIIWKVDRFGRNREEIAINKMRCRKNGVRVEYVAEKIPDTPEGVILESVLEGFAEYYSLQLSQNIRRGIAESAEKCQFTGGSRPLGYKAGPDMKFAIDEEEAALVRMIFNWYADGMACPEIAERLNSQGFRTLRNTPFSASSLRTLLKNEKYRGVFNNLGKHIEGGVPRIVEDELFYKVQEMLKENRRAPAKVHAKVDYILSDKLFCGKCGSPMYGECGTSRNGVRHNYYSCYNRKKFHTCDKKPVRQADIESLVLNHIYTMLHDREVMDYIVENTWQYYLDQSNEEEEELNNLTKQLEQVEKALTNTLRAMDMGLDTPTVVAHVKDLEKQKAELESAIAEIELAPGFRLQKSYLAFSLAQYRDADYSDPEMQKKLIYTFINAVFVYDDYIKVVVNISGEERTVTLQLLESVERGEMFARKATCSTMTTHRVVIFLSRGDENGHSSESGSSGA